MFYAEKSNSGCFLLHVFGTHTLCPCPHSPGIIRDTEDVYDLKNPTLFIFAENDAVIPLEQVRWHLSSPYLDV